MKKLFYVLPVLALIWACNGNGSGGSGSGEVTLTSFTDSASYAQGVMMGQQLKTFQEEGEEPVLNPSMLKAGMEAAMEDGDLLLTDEEIQPIMMKFQTNLQQASQKKAAAEGLQNKAKGAAFLAENATKEGVKTTESGIQYIVLREGDGASPKPEDQVEVNYEGRLIDGKVFDSSYERGEPVTFGVGQVIPGWTEGLQLMKEGSKFQFFIPAELAYGERGSPPNIGPGATLIFDVELLKVNP